MPYAPFDMGNVLAQSEAIVGRRNQNALARQQLNPNSLQNQIRQAELDRLNAPASPQQYASRPAASIQEYQFVEGLRQNDPEAFKRFMDIKRKAPRLKWINLGNEMQGRDATTGEVHYTIPINVKPGQTVEHTTATTQAEQDVKLETEPQIAAAVSEAKFNQDMKNLKPKRIGAADAALDRTVALKELIAQAKAQATGMTTGFTGNLTKGVAGTPAHDLSQTLLTLQANAGFDRLQEMRNNSVTGGALGQVSERELGLLMAAYAALEQSQSKGQFIQNLNRFEKQVEQSWKRVKLAYRLDYNEDYKEIADTSQAARDDMSDEDYNARRKALLGAN